jgi:MFS family permease
VYWSSTIIASRTGVSSAESTLLASLFVAGMFVGRAAIGRGLGANRAPRRLLAVGLCGAIAGASLMWVSTMPALSAIGLFVGGLGTAGLWPVGLSVALQTSPNARLKAAAWATVASGFATLLAPSALGLAADIVGVAGAWPIVMCLAAAALLVLAVTPRAR